MIITIWWVEQHNTITSARWRDQSKPQVRDMVRYNRNSGDGDVSRHSLLGGMLVTIGLVGVTRKAHQHYQGLPYSPWDISTNNRGKYKFISHWSTPIALESPTSKSNSIKGVLKTCSNHIFLWSKEGEGVELSLGEISLTNLSGI